LLKDFYHLKRDNNPLREDAFTLSCLGKLNPASSSDFIRCSGYLAGLLENALSDRSASDRTLSDGAVHDGLVCCRADSDIKAGEEVLIVGLTESGIIPAFLMYMETLRRNLNTHILYSTRRPLSGISFKERHSHGPDHILPLPDCTIREIWIVEDEITTGNTVYHLMVQLCAYLNISRVRIFAFADFRESGQKSELYLKTAYNNIECTVHTLNHIPGSSGQDTKEQGQDKRDTIERSGSQNSRKKVHFSSNDISPEEALSEKYRFKDWHLPEKRPALAMKSGNFLDLESWKLPPELSRGIILTIGEAVDLSACFAIANENIEFQQISLSPWKVDHKSIFSRIIFGEKYHLYNYERLKEASSPLFILCDPIDREIEQEVVRKLGEHDILVEAFNPSLLPRESSGNFTVKTLCN